jgi:hypothetical protein
MSPHELLAGQNVAIGAPALLAHGNAPRFGRGSASAELFLGARVAAAGRGLCRQGPALPSHHGRRANCAVFF